jgi:hypothetical protein
MRAQCLFEQQRSSRYYLDATITEVRSRRCMLPDVRHTEGMWGLRRWSL